MRTYILSMCDMRNKKYTRYQCQASSFKEAVAKAQADLNGFPAFAGNDLGVRHASLNA